ISHGSPPCVYSLLGGCTMVSANTRTTSSASLLCEFMFIVPSAPTTVTVLCPGAKPLSTCSGSHGLADAFSAQQNEYLPGWPCVARSSAPGNAPPTLRRTSRMARPNVAFVHVPSPRQLNVAL